MITAGAVDPGPARATGRAAGPRRPAARALPRPALGLPRLAEPLAAPADPAEGDGLQRVPADVPPGAPELPAGARVAGLRVAAAPGGQAGRAQAGHAGRRRPTRTGSTRRCSPGCSPTSACATPTGATTSARAGRRFAIFPGSGLFKSPARPRDGRRAGRDLAALGTAERRDRPACGPSGSAATWSSARTPSRTGRRSASRALAHERVTLYGVPLVADRVVPLGRHQPDVARELFVRHALVQGEWRARHRFFETNRRLLERGRRARAPGPSPRHRGRRGDALRLLRRAHPGRGGLRRALRHLVEAGAPRPPRPAHLRPGDAGARGRRARRGRLPRRRGTRVGSRCR